MSPAPKLVCSEGKLAVLLAQLAVRQLDLIVSDVPLPGNSGVKAFSHLLGRSGITFFAAPALLAQRGCTLQQARRRFPGVEAVPFDELDLASGTLRTPQP